MIVTEIYNGQGLGNQLWCYASTRAIAKNKGYEFGIMNPERFKCLDFMEIDFGNTVIGGAGPEGGPTTILPEGIKNYYQEKQILYPGTKIDIRIHDEKLVQVKDNTKIDGIMQDEQYILKYRDEIREWFKVKKEYECLEYASDDICIINFRGGEYVGIHDVFLPQKYWDDAVVEMQKINPNFKFIVITDDVITAKRFFPKYDVYHFDIAKDYSILNNAHYLIVSNSSFAFFPAWTSTKLKHCIAPKYWSRYNISDGFWSCGYNIFSFMTYLDRAGNIFSYEACLQEFEQYQKNHPRIFPKNKIEKNFLVISSYNHTLEWVPEYTDNYLIYDRSPKPKFVDAIDKNKVITSPNVGYNSYDYCRFIADHYDNLPDVTIFAKGWSFPRHVRKEVFDSIMNNEYFTPIEDWKRYKEEFPTCFLSPEGGFCEINNSWYLRHHKTKYFHNYNDFLRFCFIDPVIPQYVRLAPGGDCIIPKANILKYPKVFYQNLQTFMSHCQEPGETHIIERAWHAIMTGNFEISEQMLHRVDDTNFKIIPPIYNDDKKYFLLRRNLQRKFKKLYKIIRQKLPF